MVSERDNRNNNKTEVCRNFGRGVCRWGATCRYIHDSSRSAGTRSNSSQNNTRTNTSNMHTGIGFGNKGLDLAAQQQLLSLLQAQNTLLAQYGLSTISIPRTPIGFNNSGQCIVPAQPSAQQLMTHGLTPNQHALFTNAAQNTGNTSSNTGQETVLPTAFNTMTLQDPANVNWHMDMGASSHLNSSAHNLSTIFNSRVYPSVLVGDGKSIPVTNTGHSTLPTPYRPLHLNNVLVTPNIYRAMLNEYNDLIKNNTWVLVPRPPDVNIVRSLWLFRHKHNANGSLNRYKARLVANGSTQLAGIDVDENFSPVVKPDTVRIVLSLAISRHWTVHQLDVKNAFLHGLLSETVYMHQPPGFRDPRHPDHGSDTAYLLLYVDDIVLTASSTALLHRIIASLHAEFSMTDLGPLNYFLDVSVTRNTSGMFLSQQKYATEVLERAGMLTCNQCRTPVDTDSKLAAAGDHVSDPTLYRSLAGALQYLTFTRPDISYAVQQSYSNAFRDPNWYRAMLDEYNALIKNNTWVLVPRPPDANIVRSLWLFRHKHNADGSLNRYKARLVANGNTQIVGIDVDETFSPVVKPATIRTVLSLAISRHWPVHQLDVKNAFLHGSLSETVYMYQPPGFRDPRHPDHGSDTAYLLLYVDNIVLTASSTALLQRIIAFLYAEFSMTDLGPLNYFLGVSVTCDTSGMFLSQQKYATKVLERAGMLTCNPCRTPVDMDSKLAATGDLVSDPTLYRSLAGALQYLTFTRPDISYAVQQLYSSTTSSLVAYSDADWARCPTTRHSTSSYCMFLGNNLLSCSSKRQFSLSRYSAEAEYRGVANAVAETCWLRNLLRELHTPLSTATIVYCDNVSAVYFSSNPVQHQCTKHIEIDIHFVRDLPLVTYEFFMSLLVTSMRISSPKVYLHLRFYFNIIVYTLFMERDHQPKGEGDVVERGEEAEGPEWFNSFTTMIICVKLRPHVEHLPIEKVKGFFS
ncbi:ribonuclease H-like domain-containing protein [Tanacetum coccineum]